jgi:hypothetical protein
MSEVGGYVLHLYCDNAERWAEQNTDFDTWHAYSEWPHEFVARNKSEADTMARDAGWTYRKDGRRYCPKCTANHLTTL